MSTGRHWLALPDIPFDVVNVQWPEYTIPEGACSDVSREMLIESLRALKKSAVLVATVHNELPHKDRSVGMTKLYESTYSLCDGFVHMGNESRRLIEARFPDQTKDKPSVVIPHGNYAIFGEREDRMVAKSNLGIADQPTALLIGAIRTPEELKLSRRLVDSVIAAGGQVIFAAKLPGVRSGRGKSIRILNRLSEELLNGMRKFLLERRRYVHCIPAPVPHGEMARVASSADITLIPRIDTLNSGNVPLAYTYGSVVCGPDVGNVGEILRETDNSVFSAGANRRELQSAVTRAFELASAGQGEMNYGIAHSDWDWDLIGSSYVNFFRSLISAKSSL